jgi:translation initiation factor 3 subunit H
MNKDVEEVVIDGLAVLKIVKHCREGLPQLVSGALLGLDQKGVLEITHSFPGVSTTTREGFDEAAEGDYAEQDLEYQLEMMTSLREVNIDNNRVGWYQSMFLGTFNNFKLIQNLLSYHESIPNSVVVLYDPVQTANGSLTIRAFRLSEKFLELSKRAQNEFIPPSEILQELPIKIRNPGLINAFLFDLKGSGALAASAASGASGGAIQSSLSCDFDRLDLSTNPYLEKNLEYLCAWVDDLTTEQYKFREEIKRDKWRRKQDGGAEDEEFQAPDRLASLLVNNQIQQYCQQIQQFGGISFGKLFLAGSLQHSPEDDS